MKQVSIHFSEKAQKLLGTDKVSSKDITFMIIWLHLKTTRKMLTVEFKS